MGLIIGALVGVIALILYEQTQKPAISSAAAAASAAAPQDNAIAEVAPAASSTTGLEAATAKLPQFDSTANASIIDLSQHPAFNGTGFTCNGGSVPYYDPKTQAVYCVIPGAAPTVNEGDNIITQGATSSLFGEVWSEIL